jgi:hypothetical protein
LGDRLRDVPADIPDPHQIIVNLPFAAVVTTNYDKLLENAYLSLTHQRPKMPTHLDRAMLGTILFDGSFFILKAHGDIDRPDSLVLTARDYQDITHSNPAFDAVFSALLLTNALLFVGYSLSDPDFRLLLDRQLATFGDYVPDRYAVMPGMSRVERDVLWRTARVKVLSYEEGAHEQVVVFLRALAQAVEQSEPQRRSMESPSLIPAVPINKEMGRTVLSIRARGLETEATLEAPDGAVTARGVGQLPDWTTWTSLVGRKWWLYSGREGLKPAGESVQSIREIGELLAECLGHEVRDALQQVPSDGVVVLDLTKEIEIYPWEWTRVGDKPLVLRNPAVRAPIGISDAARGKPSVPRPVRALLIGDPTDDLPGARAEIESIAELYESASSVSCTKLISSQAHFDNVVKHLLSGDYGIVHFAGWAWFDEQETWLYLHNKVVLRASELRSLLSPHPPAILIFNSKFTAFVPAGVPIEHVTQLARGAEQTVPESATRGRQGYTAIASATGVGTFIGCIGIPSDKMATKIGIKLHQELLDGAPISAALYRARLTSMEEQQYDTSGLLYAMSGYPELTLR